MAATIREWSRIALVAVASLLAAGSSALAAGWEVRTLKAGQDAAMPWVTGPDASVAARIDALLFLDVLEAAPPKGDPTAFTVPTRDGAIVPVTPSGFRVLRQDDRVLSIVVEAEGCGAYCENFEKPFLFDLATGRRVTDRDLLTPRGRRELSRRGLQDFVAALGRELARLQKRQPRGGLSEDDVETLRALYSECRDRQREWAQAGKPFGSLRIGRDGAELVFGRCSNHAMRALDDLGDHTWRIAPGELAPNLTAYGRRLLLGEGDAAAPDSPLGQVFAGSVGSAPVRLATSPAEDDGSFSGTYYYERYRKPIELGGRLAGGTWTLTERDDASGAGAQWTLRRDGTGWSGTWAGVDGRRLPVRLAP